MEFRNNNIIVAIDGHSSCGKSTLAKALAKELDFLNIDSGAMYRAVALYFINQRINSQELAVVENIMNQIKIELFHDNQRTTIVMLNDVDVSGLIRNQAVTKKVSEISSIRCVREKLVEKQQRLSLNRNIVMEGRDIGTVVFPHAQVKIFMTADLDIRALRRYKEISSQDSNISYDIVYNSLKERDFLDCSRKESPLMCPIDATVLNTTNLSETDQLVKALEIVKKSINNNASN